MWRHGNKYDGACLAMIKLNNHSSKRNETILEVVIFVDVVWVITERKARLVGFGCSFDETPRCIVDSDVVRFCSSPFLCRRPTDSSSRCGDSDGRLSVTGSVKK